MHCLRPRKMEVLHNGYKTYETDRGKTHRSPSPFPFPFPGDSKVLRDGHKMEERDRSKTHQAPSPFPSPWDLLVELATLMNSIETYCCWMYAPSASRPKSWVDNPPERSSLASPALPGRWLTSCLLPLRVSALQLEHPLRTNP
jgi:hypothetical protein